MEFNVIIRSSLLKRIVTFEVISGHFSNSGIAIAFFSAGGTVRGQESSTWALAAPPFVINFHPLPRGNVSITRQPQPGCSQFHQTMSRDQVIVTMSRHSREHVIVIDLRKAKETKLPSILEEVNLHAQKGHN